MTLTRTTVFALALMGALCGMVRAETRKESVDPCEVNKDSSACTWSWYGEDRLDPPPKDGSDVLRVWSYIQAGPYNSVVVQLRRIPGFGVFMTVRQPTDQRGRIFLRVPDSTWDKASSYLDQFRAYTTKIGLKEYEQPGCLDGDMLDIDTLTDGKPDHLHGYECEGGPAITLTMQMKRLVLASIPFCANAGTDNIGDCFLLEGDKFLAAQVLKPLDAFNRLGCDSKPALPLRSIFAKDVKLSMVDRAATSGADAVAQALDDLACPRAERAAWNIGWGFGAWTIEGQNGTVVASGNFRVSREHEPSDLSHPVDNYEAPATLTWRRDARGELKVTEIQIGKLLLEK